MGSIKMSSWCPLYKSSWIWLTGKEFVREYNGRRCCFSIMDEEFKSGPCRDKHVALYKNIVITPAAGSTGACRKLWTIEGNIKLKAVIA